MREDVIKVVETILEYYQQKVDEGDNSICGICIELFAFLICGNITKDEHDYLINYLENNRTIHEPLYYFKDDFERIEVLKKMIKEFKEKISCC